jgi:hypothetical protein
MVKLTLQELLDFEYFDHYNFNKNQNNFLGKMEACFCYHWKTINVYWCITVT